MSKKQEPVQSPPPAHGAIPVPPDSEPHHDVASPDFERDNERMKLAAKPNDGQPLAHRNRGKAGRKG